MLSCIAVSAACDGGDSQVAASGDTEVNLVISDPATAADQILPLIDFVSYRITCLNNPNLTQYDDSVDIAGNFELDATGMTPVWQLVTDLPLSACTISMWVFFEDEVICSGTQVLEIYEDGNPLAPNKADVVLECNLSVNGPSGDVGVDGTFEFIHGNYCPQLLWLGAVPTAVPTVMSIETSSFDPDSTCGLNCDPQTCDFNQTPPVCTPGPDLGLSNTLSAPAGNGTFGTASAIGDPNMLQTTYACDPFYPGPTEICVVASDGDNDCDQFRCTTVICPDLCEGVDCDDGNECTRDRCIPITGVCANDVSPSGIACDACNSTCQAGVCDPGVPFTAAQNATVMNFVGSLQPYAGNLFNPYSGQSVFMNGTFNINTSSYKGVSANDTLVGTTLGDFLLVRDPAGTQRICGVENVDSLEAFDVMFLADSFVMLDDMIIEGGDSGDLIWANAGHDTLRGNDGNDLLDGGPGIDVIQGGNGNDTITLWPGSGYDSITGGTGTDRVQFYAIQSQITVSAAVNPSFEFDIEYLGVPMAQIREIELLVLDDASIDLTNCVGGDCNLCGNDALNGGEECDDGNNIDGDGCAADCTSEY